MRDAPSNLALRNLLQDTLRLVLSVLGVALVVMLILFLKGLYSGFLQNAGAYLRNNPGSIVVLPPGVKSTFTQAGGMLSADTTSNIEKAPGVAQVTPVLRVMTIADLHGRKEALTFVGYDPALGGGPWDIAKGRAPISDDEVVLDRLLGERHGYAVGDKFAMLGRQLTVVGLSNGTSSISGAFAFAQKSLVESLMLAGGQSNLLFITPAADVRPSELVDRLQESGTNALLKRTVIAKDQDYLAGIFNQVVNLMIGAAFIVGALVVGMVIYTATIERQKEYGVLKAIGVRNLLLYRIVLSQALIAACLGAILGVGLAYAMGWTVEYLKPQFPVRIEPAPIAATLVAGLVMAVLGAALPARSIARLAPAEVFRK